MLKSPGAARGSFDLDGANYSTSGDRVLEVLGLRQCSPSLEAALIKKANDLVAVEDDSGGRVTKGPGVG
jgi:hypothetical protein